MDGHCKSDPILINEVGSTHETYLLYSKAYCSPIVSMNFIVRDCRLKKKKMRKYDFLIRCHHVATIILSSIRQHLFFLNIIYRSFNPLTCPHISLKSQNTWTQGIYILIVYQYNNIIMYNIQYMCLLQVYYIFIYNTVV